VALLEFQRKVGDQLEGLSPCGIELGTAAGVKGDGPGQADGQFGGLAPAGGGGDHGPETINGVGRIDALTSACDERVGADERLAFGEALS